MKFKFNKTKIILALFGTIGITSCIMPILVSCSEGEKTQPPEIIPPPIIGITPKEINYLSIIEMNAIVVGNRDIALLSRAFDGINAENVKTIESATVKNYAITLKQYDTGYIVTSQPLGDGKVTSLDNALVKKAFEPGGIWYGKTEFNEIDLQGITEIKQDTFNSKGLTSLKLPISVQSIGRQAFSNNKLTSIQIQPNSISSIEEYTFSNNQLKEVSIPIGVKTINQYAFSANQIASLTIPSTLTSIGNATFKGNKISEVTLPDSLVSIGDEAFMDNIITSSVFIPDSVNKIGKKAFQNNKIPSLSLSNSLKTIEINSFQNNKLTSIIIPSEVAVIGENAFTNNSLTNIFFKNRNLLNQVNGFIDSSGNNSGSIRNNYKKIFGIDYKMTFNDITPKATNDLTIWEMNAIENGNKDIKLLNRAFDGIVAENYSSIKNISVKNNIITITNDGSPSNSISSIPMKVTTRLSNALTKKYFASDGIWANKRNFDETDLKGTTEIVAGAFRSKRLQTIIIPASLRIIGDYAFYDNQLTSLVIPSSVIEIRDWAFFQNQLNKLEINAKLKKINDFVFQYNKLTSIVIPDSVNHIGMGSFAMNEISSVILPNSIKIIDYRAFACNKLSSLTLPKYVEYICDSSFSSNYLSAIVIPDSVIDLNRAAFYANRFKSSTNVTISQKLLNSICTGWLDPFGNPGHEGNGKTVKQNFFFIFNINY